MPSTQLTFNTESFWTNTVHEKERHRYSQEFLDKNRKRFGGQNKRVFQALMNGEHLDDDIVRAWKPEIRHLHSRISDLRNKMNFDIETKPHPTKNLTVYFMTKEQIQYNTNLLSEIMRG